jgi:two-component system NtrC family sensor kinase
MDSSGERNFIEIVIRDTGCGIKKDDLEKIFDPFFSTKGQKGTGLGLSVIWGIIDNHKGQITVESEIDKGTSFTIRLPES